MFYLLLLINLCLPAWGLWTLEHGGLAPMLDFPYGYPNGATSAYLVHLFWFLLGGTASAMVFARRPERGLDLRDYTGARTQTLYLMVTAGVFVAIAALALSTGGWGVFTGAINKADLRIARHTQGVVGVILTMALNWYMPCAFAVLAVLGRAQRYTLMDWLLVAIATGALAVTGLSTGFKTTVLFVFQPYLVLKFWRLGVIQSTLMVAGAFAVIFTLSMFFDGSGGAGETLANLKDRATNYQGDLAWGIWEKATRGERMPPYARTFLSIPGSRFLNYAFGVDQAKNPEEFSSYYFGPSATLFGGYPIEGIEQGINNQATLFGEAVIAMGPRRYMFFSLCAGVVFGGFVRLLRRFIWLRDPVWAPVGATFLCTSGLSWLVGNGAASMFYVINLVGLLATGTYIYLLLKASKKKKQA